MTPLPPPVPARAPVRRRARPAAAVLCALLASACGGESGGGADEGAPDAVPQPGDEIDPGTFEPRPAARHGTVVIEERGERFHLDAWFVDGAAPPGPPAATDVCRTRRAEAIAGSSPPSPPRRLSAGETLEIVSREGVWATLERQGDGADAVYATERRSVPEALPDDAVLSVPGGEFPAVPPLALAPLAPLELLVPEGTRDLPPDRRVRWTPGPGAQSRIALVLRESAPGGTGGPRVDVLCTLVDDGEFVVPAEAVPFERPWISRVARVRETRTAIGPEATLVVEQLSER